MTPAITIIFSFIFGLIVQTGVIYMLLRIVLNSDDARLNFFEGIAKQFPADWFRACPLCKEREKLDAQMMESLNESFTPKH